jgi:hypothetical protein
MNAPQRIRPAEVNRKMEGVDAWRELASAA